MPITEVVTPFFKQDESTASIYEKTFQPGMAKEVGSAVGLKASFSAHLLTENGVNVQSAVRYAVGIEWEDPAHFHAFLASPGFKAIAAQLQPLVTAPPKTQIYDTDLSPVAAFSSHLTEVYRINIGNAGNDLDVVREAWRAFVATIELHLPHVPSLSGPSLNLEEQLFLGVVGWDGVEARESIVGEEAVREAKAKLTNLKAVEYFTVSFVAQ